MRFVIFLQNWVPKFYTPAHTEGGLKFWLEGSLYFINMINGTKDTNFSWNIVFPSSQNSKTESLKGISGHWSDAINHYHSNTFRRNHTLFILYNISKFHSFIFIHSLYTISSFIYSDINLKNVHWDEYEYWNGGKMTV